MAEYDIGGVTLDELARKHGVNLYTLKGRLQQLRRETRASKSPLGKKPKFVRVAVPTVENSAAANAGAPVVTVIGASPEQIAALVRCLGR
jgi:transposase-like protein